DERWAGASSLEFCRQIAKRLSEAGWAVENLSVTVVCDRPRLGPLLRPGAIDRLAARLDDLRAPGTQGPGVPGRRGGDLRAPRVQRPVAPGRRGNHPRVHGVAPGAAVIDTVRRVAVGNRSGGIVHREELRTLQTPQVFVRTAFQEAHRRAAAGELADPGQGDAAGDAVLLELAGFPVAVVAGEPQNLTIVTALDLEVAEVLAARSGQGRAAG
ncbi:MAG TPA: 2-C-methyl-D-erythritol 2,4-cyclodiphosphate synthase, partial [Actinomycetes bacterium]|nr:2-C-methyl-D-erythritol 2,4-cyclodiphosphate synthase [Actinomycetes bacterium]